jgi:23S rRNA (guanosine2251-2'-O)-methyltransferase
MIVILHNLRSKYNVGSIFRTADAAGVEKIYLGGVTPAPVNILRQKDRQIAKTALGAQDSVAWEKIGHSPNVQPTVKLVKQLKDEGYKILAVEQDKKSIPYYKLKITQKDLKNLVLVFGYEIKGLPPAILKLADKILEIPMRGQKESLNVSVAFGIVVYSIVTDD